jgi:hypothetical protein
VKERVRGVVILDIAPTPIKSANSFDPILQAMMQIDLKEKTLKEIQAEVSSSLTNQSTLTFIM